MSTERVVTVMRSTWCFGHIDGLDRGRSSSRCVRWTDNEHPDWLLLAASIILLLVASCSCPASSPCSRTSGVYILFGNYRGALRKGRFHWANPFYSNGNPAPSPGTTSVARRPQEVDGKSAVQGVPPCAHLPGRSTQGQRQAWQLPRSRPWSCGTCTTPHRRCSTSTTTTYVTTQAETALRSIATAYSYNQGEDGLGSDTEITLRGNPDEVSATLRRIWERGCARRPKWWSTTPGSLDLAYAPEIAQAMLRRQQAEAVIAARRKIVTGAVRVVEMALAELDEKAIVQLDGQQRAAMVVQPAGGPVWRVGRDSGAQHRAGRALSSTPSCSSSATLMSRP